MAAKPVSNNALVAIGAVFILLMILVLNAYFLVPQGRFALKFKFGEIVRDSQTGKAIGYGPGFHFKIPFVNTTKTLDSRLRDMQKLVEQVYTEDNQPVKIDYYVTWRIEDLAKYYTTTNDDLSRTENLINQSVNSQLRNLVGDEHLRTAVTDNRERLMQTTLDNAKKLLIQKYGIRLDDFRVIRIELQPSTRNRVYDAMIKNRESEREKYISEGKAENIETRTGADAAFVKSIANAQAGAQKDRATADTAAAETYNKAYGKNEKFYAFYRSLIAYSHVFAGKNSIMVMKPKDQFLRYFSNKSVSPQAPLHTKR